MNQEQQTYVRQRSLSQRQVQSLGFSGGKIIATSDPKESQDSQQRIDQAIKAKLSKISEQKQSGQQVKFQRNHCRIQPFFAESPQNRMATKSIGDPTFKELKFLGGQSFSNRYTRAAPQVANDNHVRLKTSGNFFTDLANCISFLHKYLSLENKDEEHSKQQSSSILDYTSGESGTEFISPFSDLSTLEKEQRMRFLWNKMYRRARGATHLVVKLRNTRRKIELLGKFPEANEIGKQQEDIETELRKVKCVILPSNVYKQRWDIYIALILLVISIYVPLRVSFFDDFSYGKLVFELITDISFFIDIILTFFTAIQKKNGKIDASKSGIARNYLKGWFLIDISSNFPVEILDLFSMENKSSSTGNTKLLRLLRLPRLWRLVKLVRLLRMTKVLKNSKQLEKFKEALNLNEGVQGLLNIFMTVFLLNHIASCFFFFIAKFYDFPPDCWVVVEGVLDAEVNKQYMMAFYWSLQTLATVGFGDINYFTVQERIFSIGWMVFGIGFYSYAIGNMTNLIAAMDSSNEELQKNLGILKEYRKRTGMPVRIFGKIKRHLENNSKAANSFALQDKMLNDLPQALRSQVIACTHGEIIEKIYFFQNKKPDFLMSIIIHLKPLKVVQDDILYQQRDHAEEIYFLKSGKIKLHVDISEFFDEPTTHARQTKDFLVKEDTALLEFGWRVRNIPFIAYLEGSYFGDSDFLNDFNSEHNFRDGTAITEKESNFFILSKESILKHKQIFRDEMQEMEEISARRRKKHRNLIKTLAAKVNLIKKEHPDEKNIDYEYYLIMKDEFHYESLSSEEENTITVENADSIQLKTKIKSWFDGKLANIESSGLKMDAALNKKRDSKNKQNLFKRQQQTIEKAKKFEMETEEIKKSFTSNMEMLERQAVAAQQISAQIQMTEINTYQKSLESTKRIQKKLYELQKNATSTDQYLDVLLSQS